MKRIGIITLVFNNYGTRLQSYALSLVIKTILDGKAEVEVVNIGTNWETRKIGIFRFLYRVWHSYGIKSVPYLLNLFSWVIESRRLRKEDHSKEIQERIKYFELFAQRIPYSQGRYTYEDIRQGKISDYDVYLVGSDQVWNALKVGNQDIYLLDFPRKESIGLTYAASFGQVSFDEKQKEYYKLRLSNFSSLLLREDEAVTICKRLGRGDAKLVLDPTLLLDAESYNIIANEKRAFDEDYVLVYSLNQSKRIFDEAYELAQSNGCKMVVLKRSICPPRISKYDGAVEIFAAPVEEFLSLIKNSKCVVTNSYHALIFSILFSVDFYLYLDNFDEENSRMTTLCKTLDLENHIFWQSGHLPKIINEEDYSSINIKLVTLRETSVRLLKESLDNAFVELDKNEGINS